MVGMSIQKKFFAEHPPQTQRPGVLGEQSPGLVWRHCVQKGTGESEVGGYGQSTPVRLKMGKKRAPPFGDSNLNLAFSSSMGSFLLDPVIRSGWFRVSGETF